VTVLQTILGENGEEERLDSRRTFWKMGDQEEIWVKD
jgi:hypothetical protein